MIIRYLCVAFPSSNAIRAYLGLKWSKITLYIVTACSSFFPLYQLLGNVHCISIIAFLNWVCQICSSLWFCSGSSTRRTTSFPSTWDTWLNSQESSLPQHLPCPADLDCTSSVQQSTIHWFSTLLVCVCWHDWCQSFFFITWFIEILRLHCIYMLTK